MQLTMNLKKSQLIQQITFTTQVTSVMYIKSKCDGWALQSSLYSLVFKEFRISASSPGWSLFAHVKYT